MSALLRDAWIQVFGGVAALCLVIMAAEHLSARRPAIAHAPASASSDESPSAPGPAAARPPGGGGLSRPFDSPGLSAPAPMVVVQKPAASPLPLPPDDSDDEGSEVPVPARPANPVAPNVPAAPEAKEQVKIIRLNNQARWNKDIFRKKK